MQPMFYHISVKKHAWALPSATAGGRAIWSDFATSREMSCICMPSKRSDYNILYAGFVEPIKNSLPDALSSN